MLETNLNLTPHQRQILTQKINHIRRLFDENLVSDELSFALDDLEEMLLASETAAEKQLSAQLSLYPLRQASLSPCINEALLILKQTGLDVYPGSMSTVVSGSPGKLWAGLQKVFTAAEAHGELVMVLSISNACPKPDQT